MNSTTKTYLKDMNQDLKALMYGIQDKYSIDDIEEFKRVYKIQDIENFENFENYMDIFLQEKKGRKPNHSNVYDEPEDTIKDQGARMWDRDMRYNYDYNNMDSYSDMTRGELMLTIMKYQLAALDSALFLDTHPNDPYALIKHNEYATKLCQYKNEYTKLYGPLDNLSPDMSGYWRYIDCPWPWEQNFE